MADQRALIGTSLDQVSTNAMLGTLAFQDADGAYIEKVRGAVALEALSKDIADTAVDVFVYDTRKDSDGGAWRHRTQHTSWYNETLNTATRGSRREFPAVAVIVATENDVIIYDGDDPDLPMWMKFIGSGGARAVRQSMSSITMLNGLMTAGRSGSERAVGFVNFVSDYVYQIANNGKYEFGTGGIINRNTDGSYINVSPGTQIVNNTVNDVAMTVLPNAPIDPSTGLPIPTIAVATDGGVSVIKDDGSVSDLSRGGGSFTSSVQFTDNNSLMLVWGHVSDAIRHINHYSYADWQTDKTDYDQATGYHELSQFGSSALQSPLKTSASGIVSGVLVNLNGQNRMSAKWDDYGLKLADLNDSDRANGMVAHIRPEYNSGWMHGDIKGAFLSDTTVESFSPSNLVTEDFSANWTGSTGGVLSVSSGQLTITNTGSNGRAGSNQFATTSGKKYAFIVKGISSTGGGTYRSEVRGPELVATSLTAGTLVIYFNGTGNSTTYVELYAIGGSGVSVTYEDAYVVELEEDRSVNGKGLQVFGTITKSAVATGAELVAYSNFSGSNYLEQPYNSDLDFGTGDFSFISWVKHPNTFSGGHSHIISKRNPEASGQFTIQYGTDSTLYLRSNANQFADIGSLSTNIWQQIAFVRRGGVLYGYKDGNLISSDSFNDNISNNESLRIGCRYEDGSGGYIGAWTGSIALLRVSASVPSPEQIQKIYEDEKVLFQENAACTLYGSSNAVTALAYDDSTQLLHVGTSSGRSEFKGLRRVGNTTTAVTTAISASSGLVAEQ